MLGYRHIFHAGNHADVLKHAVLTLTLQALLQDVLALAPLAVQETKKSLHDIESGQFDMAVMRERERQASMSEDFAEGRAAFAQRRRPVFKGR